MIEGIIVEANFYIDYCEQQEWTVASGLRQSPIDIQTKEVQFLAEENEVILSFESSRPEFLNNGQNLQLLGRGQALLNHRHYSFIQMHFHADSEHTINGKAFPLEGHFVFQSANGQLAVVAVFYQIGKHNTDFEQTLEQFAVQTEISNELFSVTELFPKEKSYYHYLGSLTTPPLTEGVEWYLLSIPVEVGHEQVERFIQIHGKNNRQIQPLNGRPIIGYKE